MRVLKRVSYIPLSGQVCQVSRFDSSSHSTSTSARRLSATHTNLIMAAQPHVWRASDFLPSNVSDVKYGRWKDYRQNMFTSANPEVTRGIKWGAGAPDAQRWRFTYRTRPDDIFSLLLAGGVSARQGSEVADVLTVLSCLLFSYSGAFALRRQAPWLSTEPFGHPAGDKPNGPVETADLLFDGQTVFFQVSPSANPNLPATTPIRCQLDFDLLKILYGTGIMVPPAPSDPPSSSSKQPGAGTARRFDFFWAIELLSEAIDSGIAKSLVATAKKAAVGAPYTRLGYFDEARKKVCFDFSTQLVKKTLLAFFANTVESKRFPVFAKAHEVRIQPQLNLAAFSLGEDEPGPCVALRRMLRDQVAQPDDWPKQSSTAVVAQWTAAYVLSTDGL
jgi:hypothetical protein